MAWALAGAALCLAASGAMAAEAKEKPALYTYDASWCIPRAQFGDMEQAFAAAEKVASQALAAGTLHSYGADTRLVHTRSGDTHDFWWTGTSLAAVLNVLDQMHKSGAASNPATAAATCHEDIVLVGHHYNWRSGTVKDGYLHGAFYQLKEDAPDDAIDTLSTTFVQPLMDKLVADGTLQGWEIDEEAIHTQKPGGFWLFYVSSTAEGLDKVNAALGAAIKGNPLAAPAFGSMIDFSAHRDGLYRTTATFK
jgi:hypothetical protein